MNLDEVDIARKERNGDIALRPWGEDIANDQPLLLPEIEKQGIQMQNAAPRV